MASFVCITIGCKVNQYETQTVGARLAGLGHTPCPPNQPADLVVINTCTVTAAAAGKSRLAVRRAFRRHPKARLLVLGCYATEARALLEQLAQSAGRQDDLSIAGHQDNVDAAIAAWAARFGPSSQGNLTQPRRADTDFSGGNREPAVSAPAGTSINKEGSRAIQSQHGARLPQQLTGCRAADYTRTPGQANGHDKDSSRPIRPPAGEPFPDAPHAGITHFYGHRRAFVKVQDGCDAFCSYCIVPHLRRRVQSRPADEILAEARTLIASGHREIVLCGVFLGAYGRPTTVRRRWRDLPEPALTLAGLVDQLSALPGLDRLRLSSLEPADVTGALLGVMAARANVVPHLHLPMQSGSAAVLERMNRQYTPEQFADAVAAARRRLDRPAISTDIIVGFPGESDDDFGHTLDLARRIGFAKIHVFPFSPRAGTKAWQWRKDVPPPAVLQRRIDRITQLGEQSAREFHDGFVGQMAQVLVELPDRHVPAGHAHGLTERHVRVQFPLPPGQGIEGFVGRIVAVRAERSGPEGLTGRLA